MNLQTLTDKPGRKMSIEEITFWVTVCEPGVSLGLIRDKRNYLLKRCDWTLLEGSSIPENKKQEWITYRQSLRNLPQQYIETGTAIWPETPQ
jgi:hypothetical protein